MVKLSAGCEQRFFKIITKTRSKYTKDEKQG